MEIIIGRNAQTGQLSLTMGTQTKSFGAANSVPRSVSRRHCRIQVLPNGTYTIENLKMENDTYVNGSPIFTKTVTPSDTVELGGEHYKLGCHQAAHRTVNTQDGRHPSTQAYMDDVRRRDKRHSGRHGEEKCHPWYCRCLRYAGHDQCLHTA